MNKYEIDVNKCEYYKECQADCICSIEQTETCDSYKLLKQLQQLKQENESLKGLITTGNKQETMLLNEIDKLQNANEVLQAILSDNAEVMKKQEERLYKIKAYCKKLLSDWHYKDIKEIIESKENDN